MAEDTIGQQSPEQIALDFIKKEIEQFRPHTANFGQVGRKNYALIYKQPLVDPITNTTRYLVLSECDGFNGFGLLVFDKEKENALASFASEMKENDMYEFTGQNPTHGVFPVDAESVPLKFRLHTGYTPYEIEKCSPDEFKKAINANIKPI